jgi:methyltransferase-like protein
MFKCYISNFVQLLMEAPPFTTEINEAPTAFSLARLQAESLPRVTNLRHEVIPVREFHREILKRLDGRHERGAVLDELVDLKLRGEFFVDRPDEMAGDRATATALIHQRLDQTLRHFAVNALLVG